MSKHVLQSLMIAASIAGLGCATTPADTLSEMDSLQGDAYRSDGAMEVQLGCYGLRVSGGEMDCTTVPNWATVSVRNLPEYAITKTGSRTLDGMIKGKAEKMGLSASATAEWEQKYRESMRVVTWVIMDRKAVRADLRAASAADSDLDRDLWPGKARVVTGVQKVYDHGYWSKIDDKAAFEGKFQKTGVPAEAEAKVSSAGDDEVTLVLGDGTTIAYVIDRFCWDELAEEATIRRTTTDFPGPDSNSCETGSTRIHPSWGSWYRVEEWFYGLFD